MTTWAEVAFTLVVGGLLGGTVQYFVRDFWTGRSKHYKKTEDYQEEIKTYQLTMTTIEARQLSRQEDIVRLLEMIHRDIQKG